MAKIAPLSGFPEWLPSERAVESHVMDIFRHVSELHGFSGIETRAVEPMSQLLRKGDIDKEVYVLRRLHADPDEAEENALDRQLGLHFDLTVPLARYVLEHRSGLSFPFRRYQIQKVWRGERPQDGRFREFYQADLDVVGENTLPAHVEAEVAVVMADILARLPLPGFTIHVNNRKLSQGFFEALGLSDVGAVLRCLDKLPKIGADAVGTLLADEAGASESQIALLLEFAAIRTPGTEFVDRVHALGVSGELLDEGLAALSATVSAIDEAAPGVCVADLSIARGLDYYTGTVYETFIHGHEDLGSICSGGRYDQLVSDGSRTYPGVGLSLGLSRLVSRILKADLAAASRPVPTCVLVAVTSEEERPRSARVATMLRSRGIPVEVAPTAAKFGKQIKYADRRGIPFVWFPAAVDAEADAADEVKDIRSGEQLAADAQSWMPPQEDLHVRIVAKQNQEH
ncbi:histidine--tRNA ligase [Devriesea agamarum]|uniref:histidine--tRNA ligase n=1 Tax=Devriesea agamarum TaxID=472569 RepID=UPI00071CE0D6|nr:histidine--tRNA ligase [Devriesea agamarum]